MENSEKIFFDFDFDDDGVVEGWETTSVLVGGTVFMMLLISAINAYVASQENKYPKW